MIWRRRTHARAHVLRRGAQANGTEMPNSGTTMFCLAYRAVFHLLLDNDTKGLDIEAAFPCQL
jgi:hypothetical protein